MRMVQLLQDGDFPFNVIALLHILELKSIVGFDGDLLVGFEIFCQLHNRITALP